MTPRQRRRLEHRAIAALRDYGTANECLKWICRLDNDWHTQRQMARMLTAFDRVELFAKLLANGPTPQ